MKILLILPFLLSPALADDFALTIYSTARPGQFNPQPDFSLQSTSSVARSNLDREPDTGYGIVRETRSLDLKRGLNTIRFTGVAAGIDPTTVSFKSLTAPDSTSVLEQNYEYDLVSADKLLAKYLDKNVLVTRKIGEGRSATETLEGTLLSFDETNLVLRGDGWKHPVLLLPRNESILDIHLPGQSAELVTKPTLVWKVSAEKPGDHQAMVTYQTDGLTWRADYNVILNKDDSKADLAAWVSIRNESGKAYPEAKLKLVAGDVQRIRRIHHRFVAQETSGPIGGAAAGFVERSFFEYHLYSLARPSSLPDYSTKQIELFPPRTGIPVEKFYVYYGLSMADEYGGSPLTDRDIRDTSNPKVDVYVRIKNSEKNGLGMPLPAGLVRVYKTDDADAAREFIGEDLIDHTPRDESIVLRLGSAFDVVGSRKQTAFNFNRKANTITENFEITLRNHKKQPVTVIVKENLYRWSNWKIAACSDKWQKQDSRTIHIPVEVPQNGEKKITYTVKYTW